MQVTPGVLRFLGLVFCLPVLCVGIGGDAGAYEEITDQDGGTLKGQVTLSGDVPRPKGYNLVTFRDAVYCGRVSNGIGWRLLQPFDIGPAGEFRNVVVMLEDVKHGKPMQKHTPLIEALNCAFAPYTSVVHDKHDIQLINKDPVVHVIQAYATSRHGARVLFQSRLPMNPRYGKSGASAARRGKNLAGKLKTKRIKMPRGRRIFVMQCGIHGYMESWALVINHPYYALTDEHGRFTIDDIPPGSYKAVVWHPVVKAGRGMEYDVTIEPKQSTTLNVEISAPKGRLYANQLEENPRFELSLVGGTKIVPSVELQTY